MFVVVCSSCRTGLSRVRRGRYFKVKLSLQSRGRLFKGHHNPLMNDSTTVRPSPTSHQDQLEEVDAQPMRLQHWIDSVCVCICVCVCAAESEIKPGQVAAAAAALPLCFCVCVFLCVCVCEENVGQPLVLPPSVVSLPIFSSVCLCFGAALP